MTDFEFLSVLVSIVIGLGLAHLLRGLGHAFHFRHVRKMDAVHVAWTLTTFYVFILNWWVFLLWRDFDTWTFASFSTVILWTTSFYVMALALYPPAHSEEVDYRTLFDKNRSWFLGTFAIMCLLDIIVTSMREHGWPESTYVAYVGHYALVAVIGIGVRRRTYDHLLAWYILATLLLWSFGVRATLF